MGRQQVRIHRRSGLLEVAEVPVRLWLHTLFKLPDRVGDVTDHLKLREVHRINLRAIEVDMNHRDPIGFHEEGGLFDVVVPNVEN